MNLGRVQTNRTTNERNQPGTEHKVEGFDSSPALSSGAIEIREEKLEARDADGR